MNINRSQEDRSATLFFSGVHMDLQCRFAKSSSPGVSNPGEATITPGGAGLNTASIYTKLGGKSALTGFIGDDEHGEILKGVVCARDIADELHIIKHASSGIYVSMIEPDGSVNTAFSDLRLADQFNANWVLKNKSYLLKRYEAWFLNANLDAQSLVELVETRDQFRPHMIAAASISPSKAPRLQSILKNLDVLFTNLSEARAILDDETLAPKDCVIELAASGVNSGSLSNGPESLLVWDHNCIKQFEPEKLKDPVDVTGAGDALAAAFLWGLANNLSVLDCAPFAIECAQQIVQVNGPYDDNQSLPALPVA